MKFYLNRPLNGETELLIDVRVTPGYHLRLWLGVRLMRLAARVLGADGATITVKEMDA